MSTLLVLSLLHEQALDPLVVVSPDVGGVVRARAIAKRMKRFCNHRQASP